MGFIASFNILWWSVVILAATVPVYCLWKMLGGGQTKVIVVDSKESAEEILKSMRAAAEAPKPTRRQGRKPSGA